MEEHEVTPKVRKPIPKPQPGQFAAWKEFKDKIHSIARKLELAMESGEIDTDEIIERYDLAKRIPRNTNAKHFLTSLPYNPSK